MGKGMSMAIKQHDLRRPVLRLRYDAGSRRPLAPSVGRHRPHCQGGQSGARPHRGRPRHLFKDIQVRDDIPKRTDLEPELTVAEKRDYKTLYGLQMGYCNGCNEHFQLRNLRMDHSTARARGGTDHTWNFQLLCGACNSTKGTKTQAEFQAEVGTS